MVHRAHASVNLFQGPVGMLMVLRQHKCMPVARRPASSLHPLSVGFKLVVLFEVS